MFNTKDIKEDYPIWEDRVKYLFKLNENNEVVRNDNLDPAYFYDSCCYSRYLNHPNKKYLSRTITNFGDVYITYEVLFYLYYGYKPKRLFNSHPKDLPVLSNLIPIDSELPVKSGERFDSKPFAIQYMNECFYLKDGVVYYNERPMHHFRNYKDWFTWNEKFSHRSEFDTTIDKAGYKVFSICSAKYRVNRLKIQLKEQRILQKSEIIDHIDRSKNNDSFDNLRIVNATINARNRIKHTTGVTSKYKGVCCVKEGSNIGKFRARCMVSGKFNFLGYYLDDKDAALAYDAFVVANNLEHTTNKELGLL